MNELSLVFFTALSQSAVGLTLIAFIAFAAGRAGQDRVDRVDRATAARANLTALMLMAAALIIGIFHLGHIFRAFNMVRGVGQSPMSDEILLCGFFIAALVFAYIKKPPRFELAANAAATLIGLLFAWSITRVYTIEGVGSWDTYHTALQMWLTVFVGGGACAMAVGFRTAGAAVLLAGAAASLLFRIDYFSFVNQVSGFLAAEQLWFWIVWALCLIAAASVAAIAVIGKNVRRSVVLAGAIAAIVGEISARIAFYNLWSITM